MSRIKKLFQQKNRRILNVYFTAGYPALEDTISIMHALERAGADMIELGIPYSDPVADGPVIQESNSIALQNGISISKIFQQLKDCRKKFQLPLILMGYLNPVMQYGIEKFCSDAKAAGADGLIIPDLPVDQFKKYRNYFQTNDLDFIFLITPKTPDERILNIDKLCSGFIYAVSSSSTTGNINGNAEEQDKYFERLKNLGLQNPILAGFGIKDKSTFDNACKHTQGGIIGSAYINALKSGSDIEMITNQFVSRIKSGK